MASGHVNRINTPNTWLADRPCHIKIILADAESPTHGT
jgi:hypothetical protein